MVKSNMSEAIGRSTWHFLHTYAEEISDSSEDINGFKALVYHALWNYPCHECRKHIRTDFYDLPRRLKSLRTREDCAMCLFILHSEVNTSLGKPEWPLEKYIGKYIFNSDSNQRLTFRNKILNELTKHYGLSKRP